MSSRHMLLLLDLDEVLVSTDARQEAAAQIAGLYLRHACQIELGDRLMSAELARDFWLRGRFDHFVDLSAALLLWFLSGLAPSLRPPPGSPRTLREVRLAFGELRLRYGELLPLAERDPTPLLDVVNELGGGYQALHQALGHDTVAHYILVRRQALKATLASPHPPCAEAPEDVLGRLWAERCLGAERAAAILGPSPIAWGGQPAWAQETSLNDVDELRKLAQVAVLGIVTPLSEMAVTSLLPEAARDVFSVLIHDGSLIERSASLPDPWPLREALRRAQRAGLVDAHLGVERVYVVSHHSATLRAAQAAGFQAVGFARRREDQKRLRALGVRAVIRRLPTLASLAARLAERG